jgi:hypothetical protein
MQCSQVEKNVASASMVFSTAMPLRRFLVAELLSELPLPQVVLWKSMYQCKGTAVLKTMDALLIIVLVQCLVRISH